MLVAFLGPDGAGKSTAVEGVCHALRGLPVPVRPVYLGKREPYLPTSRVIHAVYLRWRDRSRTRVDEAPGKAASTWGPVRRAVDWLGLANWVAEQWARYIVHVRPYLQQDGIVVTDRYAFDFAQRPEGSAAHSPGVAKLLCRVFPHPDRTYFLWVEPEVLRARKGKDAPEGLERLLKSYRALQPSVEGSRLIQTDRPAQMITSECVADIAGLLEERCSA